MSSTIAWKPQRTSPQGDFVAKAFLELLSRGSDDHGLSEPELLVRETAQNSWDARRTGRGKRVAMDFTVRTVPVRSSVRDALGDFFSGFTSSRSARQLGISSLDVLGEELGNPDLSLLYVKDTGTWGLGGPTDASVAVSERGTDRYVKFLLNIGDANTDTAAGGAYGLGRSVFWRMSECSTVIVYSRCETQRGTESRLIGLSLSENFARGGKNHTGRHWWTSKDEGQPIVGTAADRWAKKLGFAPFKEAETGTAVLVVAPYAPDGARDLAGAIARSIEYHLWPKYVEVEGRPKSEVMTFTVHHDDEEITIRDRRRLSPTPLRHYIDAFEATLNALDDVDRRNDDGLVKSAPITYPFKKLVHPRHLGRLVAVEFVDSGQVPHHVVNDDENENLEGPIAAAIAELGDSVALMRSPELIVTYRPVDRPSQPHTKIAGVFKSSKDANEYFRTSETSTHSEWDHRVAQRDGIVIKKFHELLLATVRTWFSPSTPDDEQPDRGILATEKIAEALGNWLGDWESGEGDRDNDPDDDNDGGGGGGGGSRSGRRPKSALTIDDPVLVADGEIVVNEWKLTVRHEGSFDLLLEIREADDDGRSVRQATIAAGARPALFVVTADHPFTDHQGTKESSVIRFSADSSSMNTVGCSIGFRDSTFADPITITVRALFDQGTIPVLGAEVKNVVGGGARS